MPSRNGFVGEPKWEGLDDRENQTMRVKPTWPHWIVEVHCFASFI